MQPVSQILKLDVHLFQKSRLTCRLTQNIIPDRDLLIVCASGLTRILSMVSVRCACVGLLTVGGDEGEAYDQLQFFIIVN